MLRPFIQLVLLAISAFGLQPTKLTEISGFQSPESVFASQDFVYISNLGKEPNPFKKDGDGFISKLNKEGKTIEKRFISNLNAPKGIIEVNHVLYVLDIDTIKGFDLFSKKQVFNLSIPKSVFLNAFAKLDDETLFFSDTGTGKIYKLNLANQSYEEFYTLHLKEQGGPNGLLIFDNKLIIAGYHPNNQSGGIVFSIDLKTKKTTTLIAQKESFDGIVATKQGEILISSWGSNLEGYIYIIKPNQPIKKLALPTMKGPADIYLDDQILWIPKLIENKVLQVEFQ